MRFRIGIILSLLLLTACGGGGGSNNNNNDNGGTKPTVSVKISPQPSASVVIGESTIFTVTTQNTGFDLTVVPSSGHGCSKSGNSVTCAPTAAGDYTLTVTASADTSKKETATLNVSAPEPELEPAVTIVEPADGKLSLWADQTEATISFEADGPWTITVTDVSGGDKAAMSETAAIKEVKIAAAGLPDTPPPVCYPSVGDPDWVVVSVYDGVAGIWSLALRLELNYGQCDRTAEIKVDSGKNREPVVFTIIQRGITMDGNPLDKKYDVYTPIGSPGYWKNGEKILLSDSGIISGLTVFGNDVYANGSVRADDYTYSPIYWKNGEIVKLPKTLKNSYSTAITVVQNPDLGGKPIVYVTGYESDNTVGQYFLQYWKDSVVYQLGKLPKVRMSDFFGTPYDYDSELSHGNSRIIDIAVHGDDVHLIVRSEWRLTTYIKLWDRSASSYCKNGVCTLLESGDVNTMVWARDIVVAPNGDVYIAGHATDSVGKISAVLWKNGVPQTLEDNAVAQSVFIDGNDVYVAVGKLGSGEAYYYKNGKKVSVGSIGSVGVGNYPHYERNALAVVDGDVYLRAYNTANPGDLVFWKNKEKYTIEVGSETGYFPTGNCGDMVIVPHSPSQKW
jgi:hypothetical protein